MVFTRKGRGKILSVNNFMFEGDEIKRQGGGNKWKIMRMVSLQLSAV